MTTTAHPANSGLPQGVIPRLAAALFIVHFALFIGAAASAGATPNILSAEEKAAGWRLLWDGKTTEGWRGLANDSFPANGWSIKDGVLTLHQNDTLAGAGKGKDKGKSKGKTRIGSGRDILTKERFSDFELRLDFKVTPRANSGIKYFVQPGSKVSLEYQLLDDTLHPDAKAGRDGNRSQGSLYDLIAPAASKKNRPVGEWNTARIVSRGKHIEHWLNEEKVLEYERGSPEYRALVAQSRFKSTPGYGEWSDGHILLQDHGDEVSFRNIKIRVPKK